MTTCSGYARTVDGGPRPIDDASTAGQGWLALVTALCDRYRVKVADDGATVGLWRHQAGAKTAESSLVGPSEETYQHDDDQDCDEQTDEDDWTMKAPAGVPGP